ncbi:prolipoprotein diacylglyceryl transferase [Candidatus Peregrinibacteria bacterium CG22_combo_CG10-13_8_21_14_all_44_10]|nr:MAG: prolipoprotein diacylglyceryl transferase [Candidatus Peregrinibacteria bacterium CG2_30_44_17]PIP66227.1 MAG: prolipoprotein diacylglyceryl transferase [Candidatus Peregrinibacteria bacterium CG22_combo_CG10-13_8_21_14_all_44_10]PIS04489.1 MAG: prolipoprotein diacylglyceryl transferase [Candidatus Peregrinibacteria bacterium CG10_big_fil_rev_8_21_14_0_10_44_7]PIX79650.1 MAG: prolipoprotein diacylglyceryl transferase [Candidatus Peregrinibacteria bacterium CG_4_10_14_3_um_filter_44_21]P
MLINNIDPVFLALGPVEIRYYGVMFALGALLYYFITELLFKREKLPQKDFDTILVFLFFGLLLGARFGHIVFYNLDYFMANPSEIIKIWHGGLASHGAAIGLLIAYSAFCFWKKVEFSKYADILVIAMPLVAGFVRIGNFFNSEIVGRPTDLPWGVVFERLGEDFTRHPSQIYEALLAWGVFGILITLYLKMKKRPPYFLLFAFVGLYFTTRFLVEFVKEYPTWGVLNLTTGQYLSIIPALLAAVYIVIRLYRTKSPVS